MILLTGASGFLGKTISKFFKDESQTSLGRTNSDIICDLSLEIPKLPNINIVIHSAGKAHSIPRTEEEKQSFFDVNVKGTQNLLEGLERSPLLPKTFIFISSVAVYGCETGVNINENYPVMANDPYGQSKIQAERLVADWCEKHSVICSILRLPLLVGANAPGNLGAMIRGINKGYYFNIGGGTARKSMVMAEDVAAIIPKLSEVGGTYNLTDGHHPNFKELSSHIANQLKNKNVMNMPRGLAKALAMVGDIFPKFPLNSRKLYKITSHLTFDDSKARTELGWKPRKVLDSFTV